MDLPDPAGVVRTEGPWTHRDVSANACRFHVVEAGDGPLVVLLHGFPQFWWTWRHQLVSFAEDGYHVVAMDQRGYGGSDHTPHGYDPLTLAGDVAALIRTLGESEAVVVGHGRGGLVAWTLAATQPDTVRGLVSVGMAHPLPLRAALLGHGEQRRRARYMLGFQRPFVPERQITRDDAAYVEDLLHEWGGPGWPDEKTAAVYRAAMLVPHTAHCAVEFDRWAVRSLPRRDGRRFVAAVGDPITVPVLQVHGTLDPAILPSTVDGSGDHVAAEYRRVDLDGVGHFPHEEAPTDFDAAVLPWLADLPRS
jgi:pimeloyl-ACP methyl ester carboxylesterase